MSIKAKVRLSELFFGHKKASWGTVIQAYADMETDLQGRQTWRKKGGLMMMAQMLPGDLSLLKQLAMPMADDEEADRTRLSKYLIGTPNATWQNIIEAYQRLEYKFEHGLPWERSSASDTLASLPDEDEKRILVS